MGNEVFDKNLKLLSEKMTILPDKPEENFNNTLSALWMAVVKKPVSVAKVDEIELPELTSNQVIELERLVNRRINNVPLAHLTGRQSFMGIEMLAGPEALIPRIETEILGYAALDILSNITIPKISIIDVCTGVGNLAAAMATSFKNSKIFASDISNDAISLANKNAKYLNLAEQINFYTGDLLDPFNNLGIEGTIDLITCNPPYISTSKVSEMPIEISSFEPSVAFDGGAFGINLIRRLINDANKFLANGGYLVFEVGLGQAEIIKKQVEKSKFYENVRTVSDHLNNPRVIIAQKK